MTIGAIAQVGRGMAIILLAHFSVLHKGWPAVGRAVMILTLGILFAGTYVVTLDQRERVLAIHPAVLNAAGLAVGAASVVFVSVLLAGEVAIRRWALEPEVARKLVHLASGVLAAALPLAMSSPAVVALASLFIPFMVVSRRVGLFHAVHGVERTTCRRGVLPPGRAAGRRLVPPDEPIRLRGAGDGGERPPRRLGSGTGGAPIACWAPTRPTSAAACTS